MSIFILRSTLTSLLLLGWVSIVSTQTNHSVARQWNEQLLEAISNDFARPVVHARNLYHISAAMYDAWSLVTKKSRPCLIGSAQGGFQLMITNSKIPYFPDLEAAANEAVSFAAYRLIKHRYQNAPGYVGIVTRSEQLMQKLGYNPNYIGTDYETGGPADLGNFIAQSIIEFGFQDGSNEVGNHSNLQYPMPFNPPLRFVNPFSVFDIIDPNRWQSLEFPGIVIDQSGNVIGNVILPFLGPEWGEVTPFALKEEDRKLPIKGLHHGTSPIYHDPGPPPYFSLADTQQLANYRWGFELVLKWSSHLDPSDGVLWDISPGARGNFKGSYPTKYENYRDFYNIREGGTYNTTGHSINPITGEPYSPNIVPRGDYTRVLAEFWADGPKSVTPPGHWFEILNKVMDHQLFERRFSGVGDILSALEYDVKAYLTLGGGMHDAAITAWSIKGAYDYVRPISAIRYMAVHGQSSDISKNNFDIEGLQLDPGLIESISDLAEIENNNILAKVKARAWIGPDAISNPQTDVAGVGWINPTNWMPYQRPTFVTPNFAGFISGHSTFSSAAASILENITGSAYFPGGIGEFVAKKDSFLVFEDGPSVDVILQWATYRDASDQTSLSRIWGGIHPPADDIPGRIIGIKIGTDAYNLATTIFNEKVTSVTTNTANQTFRINPNSVRKGESVNIFFDNDNLYKEIRVFDLNGRIIQNISAFGNVIDINTQFLPNGMYIVKEVNNKASGFFLVF